MSIGKILFLGTGGSVGVPMIGCSCDVCRSDSPFNKRLRPSVLLTLGQKQFLIDVGPDFRGQALKYGVTHLDGLLITHGHYDHTAGIDDLRPLRFERKAPIPLLASRDTITDLRRRYYYLFPDESPEQPFAVQLLEKDHGHVLFEGIDITFVSYYQGSMRVNGFRIGEFAYLSDLRDFPPDIFDWLQGVRYLVVSAMKFVPSPMHLSVDEAIDFSRKVGAAKVWLTHLSHELGYSQTNAYLPSHIRMGYDGATFTFHYGSDGTDKT